MYKPSNTVLSADSYTILNTIREQIGGEFKAATPLVENADDAKAYGLYVCGSGDARNSFMNSLINRIAQVICLVRSYQNSLKEFKRGMLGPGEMVENVWVGLVLPEGWTQNPANPGDVYKTNNPDNQATFHPVNSKLVYEITTNDAELSLAFTSESGVYDLVSRIVQRLTDSAEWDEYILMKYVLAKAALENAEAVKIVPELAAANGDAIITEMKAVSNDMRFMNTDYNIAGVATHSPIDEQVFFLTAKSSAVLDVNSLAQAYNLSYKQFIGQQVMINSFGFTDAEEERLDAIMTETAAQGLIPGYTAFTDEQKAILASIVGATIDRDFFMIFDKLYQMTSVFDQKHLNTNTFLHAWKVLSYNPFANSVYFAEESSDLSGATVSPVNGNTTLFGKRVSAMQTGVKVQGNKISGTLKYIEGGLAESGPLAGDGYFLALQWTDIDDSATSFKVGLDPSLGTGLVEAINDPDHNGVFKVLNNSQDFLAVTSDGTHTLTQEFDLSGLTLSPTE